MERWQVFGLVALIVFAAVAAYVVTERLSDEVLGVLAGAVCGVGAAIPTSLLIISVARWRRGEVQHRGATQPQPQAQQYPPVVVIPPGMGMVDQQRPRTLVERNDNVRRFTVVGED